MMRIEQAAIFCGGLGTRLRPLTDALPKPMALVNGKPFLLYLLQQLSAQGIKRFLLMTGYLGEVISEYFKDGSVWGWQIEYSHGPVEWDTGRRLWEARNQLDGRFLLLYSDNFVQFSLARLMDLHEAKQSSISLLLAPKDNGNIRLSSDGDIETYDKTRTGHSLNYVEVGYMLVERELVLNIYPAIQENPDFSFSEILQYLAKTNKLAGLVVHDPYHSISDPERHKLMAEYLKPKRILLIDRDGVINQKAPQGEYISTWEAFKWIPETRQAMRQLATQGFKFIVISNQAGIARGMVDPTTLKLIHQNMVSDLRIEGVEIIDIYVCPHHWDENCDCRKPNPGLFFQVSRDHLVRMDQTAFIGDDVRDCHAAYNAGCASIYIGREQDLQSLSAEQYPLAAMTSLFEAVPVIQTFFDRSEQ